MFTSSNYTIIKLFNDFYFQVMTAFDSGQVKIVFLFCVSASHVLLSYHISKLAVAAGRSLTGYQAPDACISLIKELLYFQSLRRNQYIGCT